MKKAFLSAILLIGCCFGYAQDKAPATISVGIIQQYHAKDTTRTFCIFGPDQEALLQKIKDAFGIPAADHTGDITWKGIAVKGISQKFNVHLNDGIFYIKGDGYFEYFKSAEDKQLRLARLKKEEKRMIEIELTDAAGVNAINTKQKEDQVKDFLLSIMQKS